MNDSSQQSNRSITPASISRQRFFAIVPAAGRSRRMGRSKLLLDWQGKPLLEHAVHAWQESQISQLLVVVRPDDRDAQSICAHCGVEPVVPEVEPEDMKQSVQLALCRITDQYQPKEQDRWLMAPADMPQLTAKLIDDVIAASAWREEIVVPRFGERRGHPVSFAWTHVPKVFALAAAEGINRLLASEAVYELQMPVSAAITDIDTPAEYERLRREA